jgi:hypothetical protein
MAASLREKETAGKRSSGSYLGRDAMDANPGEPWSKTDIDDLKASLAFGNGIAATANMLCRDEDEVRDKAKELGLEEHPGKRIRIVL